MKALFVFLFLIFNLLVHPTSHAQSTPACSDIYLETGNYIFQRFQGQKNCYLNATPQNVLNYYRAPVLTDEGVFMVFNSYEYNKNTDGARVFYFFPRNHIPQLTFNAQNQAVLETATAGIEIVLHAAKTIFAGMKGGNLSEDIPVHPGNQGGIELSQVQTLWLDAGFRFGGDPTADMTRTSKFTDIQGKTCVVANSEIFVPEANDDSSFKWTDTELKKFLGKRCPELKVNW